MDESLMPEWMKEKVKKAALDAAISRAKEEKNRADNLFFEKERPAFWAQLEENLRIAVSFLPKLGLRGRVDLRGNQLEQPTIRVFVSGSRLAQDEIYTDLSLEDNSIKCRPHQRGEYDLAFKIVHGSKLIVVSEHGSPGMDAKSAADHVLKEQVDLLESRTTNPFV